MIGNKHCPHFPLFLKHYGEVISRLRSEVRAFLALLLCFEVAIDEGAPRRYGDNGWVLKDEGTFEDRPLFRFAHHEEQPCHREVNSQEQAKAPQYAHLAQGGRQLFWHFYFVFLLLKNHV